MSIEHRLAKQRVGNRGVSANDGPTGLIPDPYEGLLQKSRRVLKDLHDLVLEAAALVGAFYVLLQAFKHLYR
jgi:hypothetical protein